MQDLVKREVIHKNMLQAKASSDADKKGLDKFFVLHGNRYLTFTW